MTRKGMQHIQGVCGAGAPSGFSLCVCVTSRHMAQARLRGTFWKGPGVDERNRDCYNTGHVTVV